jgi:hypothetical protein
MPELSLDLSSWRLTVSLRRSRSTSSHRSPNSSPWRRPKVTATTYFLAIAASRFEELLDLFWGMCRQAGGYLRAAQGHPLGHLPLPTPGALL